MEHIKHIWPTVRELAADLGLPYTTVHSWSVRGRIPPERDFDIIAAAKKRGFQITFEYLATARRPVPSAGSASGSEKAPSSECQTQKDVA